jgi:hypothetical protein
MALLAGAAWVRLTRAARRSPSTRAGRWARGLLQAQWVVLFVGAILGVVALRPWVARPLWPLSLIPAAALAAAVFVSVRAWRRGADAMALAPVAAALAMGVLMAYGVLAPAENPRRGHRDLARTLARLVANDPPPIHFFSEIDEGLWFYLRGLDLEPVPGTQPRYSKAYDLARAVRAGRGAVSPEALDASREAIEKKALIDWLDRRDSADAFVLIRAGLFDRYASELTGRATPVFREAGLARNELVLLRGLGGRPLAAIGSPTRR